MSQAHAGERICAACRSVRLSRYNPEPLCGPCARAARQSAGIVPAHLWDSQLLRDALARLDLGAVVAIIRTATGLSQMELGNLVDGWSQSTVSLTERGDRHGVYDLRKLLALVDAVGMPRPALAPLILGRADVDARDAQWGL